MSGKLNIVFGFFYLVVTAVLGPAFLIPQLQQKGAVAAESKKAVDELKAAQKETAPDKLAQANAKATVAIADAQRASDIRGVGAHSHGNLEALLNIVVGFILLTLVIPQSFKSLLSILFIVGAIFHSGMLYLGMVFGVYAAFNLTVIGAIAILAGLLLMGVASIMGIKKKEQIQ